MVTTHSTVKSSISPRLILFTVAIILALVAFSAVFVLLDNAYYRFAAARFPGVGTSTGLATLWGIISRAHLLMVIIPLVVWRPRLFGLQRGHIQQHGRMLLVMLFVNCGVIATYLGLTGSTTPYSGNQWLATEVIIVPVVEEIFWRGLVFAVLLWALKKLYSENTSYHLAVWLSGLAFGLLHAANSLAGVPVIFVAIQTLNATIWGVVYGYARLKTESVYPPLLLHAAMNLVVILF